MIVRIMGEGQWKLADDKVGALNDVDAKLEAAVSSGDQGGFESSFVALLDLVRGQGERLSDDDLHDSDVILPPSDSTLAEVKELISGDGLIAG
jgi:PspAA-like protein